MRLGPQQNHGFILSSKSTACSFRNGRLADMNTVGDVQGRMCMTKLFGWPGSSCRKEMDSEAR